MGSLNPGERKELRIITPIGMLGQGFNDAILWNAVENLGVDAMIMDSGSTDSGPGRLASGSLSVPQAGFEKDLAALLRVCHLRHIPILVGSAGGDGENQFVDLLIAIVEKLIKENGYRTMKIIGIFSEIEKDYARKKLADGQISPCGGGVPELTEHDISSATRIVAQMGHEPFVKAMKDNPDFDVIIGGRAYDPAPYVAFCLHKGFKNMGINYAMGKIMECGAQCSKPKSREALATVTDDYVDFMALDPKSQMTTVTVASHFLYEKTRPDILKGPGGALHLADATYEQVGYNHVRIRGPKWVPEPEGEYTLKLEGARVSGYYSIVIGAFRDPILIAQLYWFIATLERMIKERMGHQTYQLKIHRYGINGVMGALEPDTTTVAKEVCVVVQASAETQELANQLASGCKFGFCHIPYPGQVATAGNFAWPFTPCEMPAGPVAEFCIYYIMHKSDPTAPFHIKPAIVEGTNTYIAPTEIPLLAPGVDPANTISKPVAKPNERKVYYLKPEPEAGTCYLADIASVIRSKNSGPYELTLDVMFADRETYDKVKSFDVLNKSVIAKLYSLTESQILVAMYWNQAMSFKATIVRPMVSGSFGESDTHGSQQHVPLMYIIVPIGRECVFGSKYVEFGK